MNRPTLFFIALAIGIVVGFGATAYAQSQRDRYWGPRTPKNLDVELVAVDESSVTKLNDLADVKEVQMTNDFNVDVCVAVDSVTPFDCASVSITCPTGLNHSIIKAGASKSWPMPEDVALCAKSNGAPTGQFYVEERD